MKNYQKMSLLFALLIAGFIFYISSLEFPPGIQGFSYTAVLYHFGIFLLLSFFLLMAIMNKKYIPAKLLIIVLFLTITYAALDELHQAFVPGRDAAISDFAIDIIGILFSLVMLSFGMLKTGSRKVYKTGLIRY